VSGDAPRIITPVPELPPGVRWVPQRGEEVVALLNRLSLSAESKERLVDEAARILGRCVPPTENGTATGLVVGYVQSGKTLSFTTVAALARDNGYPLVIVITGTKTNLNDQSRARLEEDLGLDTSRRWRLFRNPKPIDRNNVLTVLQDWSPAPTAPSRPRQSILMVVLKHYAHLRNLIALLGSISNDLRDTPVLIVDDEADQAGLNNLVRQNRESTTYQRLVALRRFLPRHTYLQYTATPQAPLLISLIDTLSPEFAEPLSVGADYTGGRAFFEEHQNLVRVIPQREIPSGSNQLNAPPASLLEALRLFFLGVAVGYFRGEGDRENRSMLVHPSRETPAHSQYRQWIANVRRLWLDELSLPPDDPQRIALLQDFRRAYDDLNATVQGLPTFDELTASENESELAFGIRKTEEPIEVNARPQTPSIQWREKYPWILVGGEAMDRGFTVKGLTVTYMPRDLGVGNADTIQQRARFFGYKRPYLGFCRVFLEQGVRDGFHEYVGHEEDVRARLIEHREGGRPLAEWRRAFFLDLNLRPTRRQVLAQDYVQDTVSDDWYWPKVPHGSDELVVANRNAVQRFAAGLNWTESDGDDRRTPEQKHLVTEGVSLARAYSELLLPFRMSDDLDSQKFTGLRLQVDAFLQNRPDATCTVYQMSPNSDRRRSVPDTGKIPTLFQGANYADPSHTDQTYPGDERIRAADGLTIQIHRLRILDADSGADIARDVPTLAVWVPRSMERGWLVQDE